MLGSIRESLSERRCGNRSWRDKGTGVEELRKSRSDGRECGVSEYLVDPGGGSR
jgi:hypothetical protein